MSKTRNLSASHPNRSVSFKSSTAPMIPPESNSARSELQWKQKRLRNPLGGVGTMGQLTPTLQLCVCCNLPQESSQPHSEFS
eukprot:512008-Amphidinium_carterae.1